MKTKKIYVDAGAVTSIEIVYVHPDYTADASGAKRAKEECANQQKALIQVSSDRIEIITPCMRVRSKTSHRGEQSMNEHIKYCPVCRRHITASNTSEVESGEHDGYIFVHDAVPHEDSEIDALENGIN